MNKYKSILQENKLYIFLAIGTLLLAILMISPILRSGFISDDSINSFVKGSISYNHQTLTSYIYNWIKVFQATGRFAPLVLVNVYTLFTFINDLYQYKLTILIFVIIDLIAFCYFIKLVTVSSSLSILSILIAPLFFQFRPYHDPILSFNLLMQLIFLYTIVSLISLIIYLRGNKRKYLILSLLLYLLNLLTYEITYPFFILHFLIIYYMIKVKDIKYMIKLASPFLILSLLCISIPIFMRIHAGVPFIGGSNHATWGSAYIPNSDINIYMITLMKQTIAAFPLSYSINYIANISFIGLKSFFSMDTIIIMITFFFLYFILSQRMLKELSELQLKPFNVKGLTTFGIGLLFLPNILISLSPKYQAELTWGTNAYLPVYISYFGSIIIIICIINSIYIRIGYNRKNYIFAISMMIAVIFSLTGAITYNSNLSTIENLNHAWLYPRILIEDGIKNGLFESVPEDSILLVDSDRMWDQPGFFIMNSDVRFRYVWSNYLASNGYDLRQGLSKIFPKFAINGSIGDKRFHFSESDKVFYLRYSSSDRQNGYAGYAVFGKVKDLIASNKTLDSILADHLHVYAYHAGNPIRAEYFSTRNFWVKDLQPPHRPIWFGENDTSLISHGKDWELYSTIKDNITIDAKSLLVDQSEVDKGIPIVSLWGWYPPENLKNQTPSRWMESNAILFVYSNDNRSSILNLNAISFFRPRTMEIYANNSLIARKLVDTKKVSGIKASIDLAKGANYISLHVPEGCERPGDLVKAYAGDKRCLSMAVQNITIL